MTGTPKIIKYVAEDGRLFIHTMMNGNDIFTFITFDEFGGIITSNVGFSEGGKDLLKRLLTD